MTRVLIYMVSLLIISAAAIGLTIEFISPNFLSERVPTGQVAGSKVIASDVTAEAVPGIRLSASTDLDSGAAKATSKTNKQTQYGLWVFSCSDAPGGKSGNCSARLAVRDNKRNVTVVNWLVGYSKDSKLLIEITTPADVLIEPGLQMSIEGGKVRRHPYLTCGTAGCLTRIEPDAALLNSLRKAESVKLGISTPEGKTIIFEVKVSGISDSLNALAGF